MNQQGQVLRTEAEKRALFSIDDQKKGENQGTPGKTFTVNENFHLIKINNHGLITVTSKRGHSHYVFTL